ncbi:MAG: PDZ domain-containing protein [Ignavibacteriaceae bacterium]|nr:PDZ domain-containing protein [Ignavibacteriaceae bacterium]
MRPIFIQILLSVLFISAVNAQVFKQFTAGEKVYNVLEIGGLIIQSKDVIKFEMVIPSDKRPKGYEKVDIKEGDIVKMMNGKKIKDVKDIEDIYNNAKVGDDIKFGLDRGGNLFIASFKKADPSKLPQIKTITMGADGKESMLPLPGTGLIAKESGGKLSVAAVLPNAPSEITKAGVKEGDIIVSVNGVKISGKDTAEKELSKVKTGETLKMEITTGGKTKELKFKKAEESGKFIIRK